MVTRIADNLGGCVKAHGLRIEQRGGKYSRGMMLDPSRHPNQPGKGNRMAFGKAIRAKAFNLPKTTLSKFRLITARDHAGDELIAKGVDRPQITEGGHRAAQLVGLAGGEIGRNNGQLHRLFLK